MHTKWNSLGGYTVTVHRYEYGRDKDGYDRAEKASREESYRTGKYSQPPNYNDYFYVCDTKCPGDFFTKDVKDYEDDVASILGYKPMPMTDQEICDAQLTRLNCDSNVREVQAKTYKKLGYHGPIGGGEARGLKNTFNDLGMPDLVRRGFYRTLRMVKRPPSRYSVRQATWNNQPAPSYRSVEVEVMLYCYVFKSPLPNVHFSKFIKLARMYRGDKGGLRAAVKGVLANPEAHNEVETIDAIDLLAGLVGRD